MPVDPVTLEVVRNGLIAHANEMAAVLRKTAYNPMVFEVQDYCVGLIDPQGKLIAQNAGGLPIFLADLGVAVEDGIARYGLDGFEPGDAVIMNAADVCGQHLNNIVVYTPCFAAGKLVAFAACRAHWIDIGGRRVGFASLETTDIYQEGLQLRSVKVYRAGKLDENVWQIIADNVRFPDSSLGDLRAQLAACRLGERRLAELYGRYGLETVQACIREMWDQSEKLTRAAVAAIPDGVYTAESFLDSDGQAPPQRIDVKVKITVSGDEMTVDFSGVSDQVRGPMNCGASGGIAAARVAFKAVTLPNHPVDEGCFRNLKVILPPGKFLSAQPPAAIGQWSIALPTVIDTLLTALAPGIPRKVPAAHKGTMDGFSIQGIDQATRRPFVCLNILGGGWGGRPTGDGPSAAVSVCQGDVRNIPIELQEARYPLFFERLALRERSGGAGKYRGGMGIEMAVRPLYQASANFNIERTMCPPWGLQGGKPGAGGDALVSDKPGAEPERMTKRTGYPLTPESLILFRTAGGGGWGDPLDRDIALVAEDVREGYIAPEDAREYGVVLRPDGEPDPAATAALRAESSR